MTAKETIRAKLFKLRLRARQTGQVRLPASAVALWTEAGIHFLLSAVLSGAVLLAAYAPLPEFKSAVALGFKVIRKK